MTTIIDGRAIAQGIKDTLRQSIHQKDLDLALAVIIVGDDRASHSYVSRKRNACKEVGIQSFLHALPKQTEEEDLINLVHTLNQDKTVNGILIQLPLPPHIDTYRVINAITPQKDVDGLTVTNMGKLLSGRPTLVPCTPQGVLHLIKSNVQDIVGFNAVIIGRSLLFGKPMGQLLLSENCTVTHCHSHTRDIKRYCQNADIIISATGQAKMISSDWVSNNAIIIDVGISHDDQGKISGDVDFESVQNKVKAITPVPGGVGPMTVACLLKNTYLAAKMQVTD